ncbi:MAG: hypothetical protein ACK55I_20500, partial [bacterium]
MAAEGGQDGLPAGGSPRRRVLPAAPSLGSAEPGFYGPPPTRQASLGSQRHVAKHEGGRLRVQLRWMSRGDRP